MDTVSRVVLAALALAFISIEGTLGAGLTNYAVCNATLACDTALGLACQSEAPWPCTRQKCMCPSRTLFTGGTCKSKLMIGNNCTDVELCPYQSECSANSNNQCKCNTNYFASSDNMSCVKNCSLSTCSLGESGTCSINSHCSGDLVVCSSDKTCACKDGFRNVANTCTPKIPAMVDQCTGSSDCNEFPHRFAGMVCNNKKCACPEKYEYDANFYQCVPKMNQNCSSSSDCIGSTLTCTGSGTTKMCTCPENNIFTKYSPSACWAKEKVKAKNSTGCVTFSSSSTDLVCDSSSYCASNCDGPNVCVDISSRNKGEAVMPFYYLNVVVAAGFAFAFINI